MNELMWLVGHRFRSLTRREYDWVVAFDKDASLVVTCMWRLVESGRIRFTSEDDGQQFGLPAPVDAAAEVNGRLAGSAVEAVELRQGLLDLELRFSTGHSLQIIPDSSGYEAWNVCSGNRQYIAVGGGELTIFDGGAAAAMGAVESKMLAYLKSRLAAGALSVSAAEIMDAIIPSEHPEFRFRPAYKHGLDRLERRNVVNAINDLNGIRHYFIGSNASSELLTSLGL